MRIFDGIVSICIPIMGVEYRAGHSGFTLEATARASWYRSGRWHDAAVYKITRDEFEAVRAAG